MAKRWLSKVNGSGHLHYWHSWLVFLSMTYQSIDLGYYMRLGVEFSIFILKLLKMQSLTSILYPAMICIFMWSHWRDVLCLLFIFLLRLYSLDKTWVFFWHSLSMSIHWESFLTFCRLLFLCLPSNLIDPPTSVMLQEVKSVLVFTELWYWLR